MGDPHTVTLIFLSILLIQLRDALDEMIPRFASPEKSERINFLDASAEV